MRAPLLMTMSIGVRHNDSTTANCNYGSANVANVTLSHIWVTVVIGGTTYLFDPSYKPHTFRTGIADLNGAAGLTPGQALSRAASGMQTGSQSGVNYVRNLNTDSGSTSLNATLQTYGTNLLAHIQANMPAGEVEDVVGGADIAPFVTPSGGLRQTALPYSNWVVQRTWPGDIPDKYRTTLQVRIDKDVYVYTPPSIVNTLLVDKTLFVDEIYGRKLIVETNYPFNVTINQDAPFAMQLRVIDHFGAGPVVAEKLIAQDAATFRNATITLGANHPYAALCAQRAQSVHVRERDDLCARCPRQSHERRLAAFLLRPGEPLDGRGKRRRQCLHGAHFCDLLRSLGAPPANDAGLDRHAISL
jgi:hypothetical protein